MTWKTIDSAPKDGSTILVYVPGVALVPVAAYYISREAMQREYDDPDYMEEGWYFSHANIADEYIPEITIEPDYWMEVPPPPPSVR